MGKSQFQFKQFLINQEKSPLKISTEACLFGAIIAKYESTNPDITNGLDVGTGTGVLAIMIAQNFAIIKIDALEPNETAANEAANNFSDSPWPNKLNLKKLTLQNFAQTTPTRYSLIFSNPPFYSNSLKTLNTDRNQAMHQDALSLQELAKCVSQLLEENGSFWAILPPYQMSQLSSALQKSNLHADLHFNINAHPSKLNIRVVSRFKVGHRTEVAKSITIKDSNQKYTYAYSQLLEPYYTIF